MKPVVTGATFHNFEKEPKFIGILGTPVIREKDGKKDDQKAGDIIGYNFARKNGEVVIVGNSYQIKKAVETVKEGAILMIEFKGQTEGANGRVNLFKIDELDNQDEWDELEPDAKSNAEKAEE